MRAGAGGTRGPPVRNLPGLRLTLLTPLTDHRFAPFDPHRSSPAPAGDLLVRGAGRADLEALAAIRQERDGGQIPELLRRFSRALAGPAGSRLLLVGLVEGEVSGYGVVGRFDPPADAPPNHAPAGWYLQGLVVRAQSRRLGLGAELTRSRLEWLAGRTEKAHYFANSSNRASIALHARFGFEELSRDFWYPDVSFTGGEGVLFRATLGRQVHR